MQKKVILAIIGGLFLIFIILNVFISQKQTNTSPTAIPTITPALFRNPTLVPRPDQDTEYKRLFEENVTKEAPYHEAQSKIIELIKILPYNGTNFSLRYNISDNTFGLYIDRYQEAEAKIEFDEFLKEKQVNKSLIDIVTYYKN